MKAITLEYLREQAKYSKEIAEGMFKQAAEDRDPEMLISAYTQQGVTMAHNELIAYVRELTYREYLMALKNGTL